MLLATRRKQQVRTFGRKYLCKTESAFLLRERSKYFKYRLNGKWKATSVYALIKRVNNDITD